MSSQESSSFDLLALESELSLQVEHDVELVRLAAGSGTPSKKPPASSAAIVASSSGASRGPLNQLNSFSSCV